MDKALANYLKDYSRFEYEIISSPKVNGEDILVDNNREVKISGNIAYIPVNIINSKGVKTQSLVSLKLKLFKSVVIAAREIKRGEAFNSENTELKTVDVSQIRGSVLSKTYSLKNNQARLNISKDEIILESMLEKMPVIKRGDSIRACVIRGGVSIEIDATARQDGSENEIISIVTSDKKSFKARVIDRYSAIIVE